MGFDLHLAPIDKFPDWDEAQWDAYWESNLAQDSEKLGNSSYVGLVLDCITHNLESGRPGSTFPLLLRLDQGDPPAWLRDELHGLAEELGRVRAALRALPVSCSTLGCDSDKDLRQRVDWFEKRHGRPPQNLYDLCEHFVATFEQMVRKAQETRHGVVASF